MINSKFPEIGTSIFAVMSKLANEHNAINLSQGFPDFQCSPELINLVDKYMKKGYNQYAPMEGIMPLREMIAEKTEEIYSKKYNPEKEITITAGGTQALFSAITAFVREGDEVIVFEPAYDSYVPAIVMNGGRPIYIQLKHPYYDIDWDVVQRSISSRTRMIILNSPHNPSGAIFSAGDLEKLKKITTGSNIIILSDEVYEHIIFDGYEHQSVARFPQLAERSIIISSFGKTYHTTGWKMGYCLAPKELMKEFRKVHQFVVFAVNTPIQYAISEYLKNKDEYLQLGAFYQEKRDYFLKLLSGSKFTIRPSSGTYFQLLGYEKITNEKDNVFAERLTKEIGVASIPVSAFYHEKIQNNVLRFCFAKTNETLEKAAEKLIKL
ncbi:MAG TPA: aminotransferase [Bacteroidales bacterium]|nr:MAG: aminotransferase [Bacteroidetes bacterium GWF2_33_38]OFY72694.1 MAG: aminotransferase [Bacteroidetes bacterium RIFOXYA12_FULL_33_9]OFY85916.1 MAG: aminotransferase [Bacteroidetes bacterium RIFOXYA2_FULL_33_7]HBF88840.1 aminotransferase [Bacteroidales bacterium]